MQTPGEQKTSHMEWDDFFSNNNVVVPYLDVCVFATKKLAVLPPSSTVYEFGCGMGNNLKFLRSVFKDARLLGSDISQVAIEKLRAEKLRNTNFWVNGGALAIPEQDIDLVIERGAIQHVSKEQARKYVDEIYLSMKPGGEGFFEIASTTHGLFKTLGSEGHDPAYGFRTFYTHNEIKTLFSNFQITNVYHLTRELVTETPEVNGAVQGSFQVEIRKACLSYLVASQSLAFLFDYALLV